MNLTVEQRRMVVEYFAIKCVEEWPSEDMPKAEFYQDLHSEEWRLKAMKAIEKVIVERDWDTLLEEMLDYQSFDRDPEGYMYENAIEGSPWNHREYLNDEISLSIDVVARY